jgi:hypothetical protein
MGPGGFVARNSFFTEAGFAAKKILGGLTLSPNL